MKDTQAMQILRYILTYGSITQREAYRLGCTRLAARVSDLRHKGYRIISDRATVTNKDGSHSRIAVYSLAKEG